MDLYFAGADRFGKNRIYFCLLGKNKLFSYLLLEDNFMIDYLERKSICSYILQDLDGDGSDNYILSERKK